MVCVCVPGVCVCAWRVCVFMVVRGITLWHGGAWPFGMVVRGIILWHGGAFPKIVCTALDTQSAATAPAV